MIKALENFNLIIWHEITWIKRFQKLRYCFYVIANNYYATGAVSSLVEKVLKKHLNYSEGYIYG